MHPFGRYYRITIHTGPVGGHVGTVMHLSPRAAAGSNQQAIHSSPQHGYSTYLPSYIPRYLCTDSKLQCYYVGTLCTMQVPEIPLLPPMDLKLTWAWLHAVTANIYMGMDVNKKRAVLFRASPTSLLVHIPVPHTT
jgi:hypothetical protein